jgi:UDP-glucose 4-epimerase
VRIAVTGGAGFIGSHLCNFLASQQVEVLALDNISTGDWARCNSGILRNQVDIAEMDTSKLSEILTGCDEVYHLAASKLNNRRSSDSQLISDNILGTQKIFDACGIAEVKKVFFSSSLYVYGSLGPNPMKENDNCTPTTQYGLSKLWGEACLRMYAQKYGFKYIIGRLFFTYGPNQFSEGGYKSVIKKNVERLLAGQNFTVAGDGKQELDYVHVDDCVKIIASIMRRTENCTLNVSRGVGVSINKIAEIALHLNDGGTVDHTTQDWTHGSKRVGDNTELMKILPNYSFIDMKHGIESVFNESI